MAYISLGNIDKSLIPIIIGCIVCFLNRLLNQYDGTLLFKNLILTNIYISFSRFLAVIPYIILKRRSKHIQNNDLKSTKSDFIEYIYIDNEKGIIKRKGRLILLSGVLYLIQQILFVATFSVKTNSWIWIIIITSVFYYLIFKIKLYKHHYLSAILILLIGIIIDLILENFQKDIMENLLLLLVKFIREILFSLYNVLAKYVMEKKFVSVYEFSFFVGVTNLIILGIIVVFDYYYFGIDNYKEYFNNFNTTELLVMLAVISTQFGINLTSLFTVKISTPCHIFMMFVFGQLAYYIKLEGKSIIVIIFHILILFLSLIFNEIIEINCCGLSYNTKKNIINRAQNEEDSSSKRDLTIDSSYSIGEHLSELEDKDSMN